MPCRRRTMPTAFGETSARRATSRSGNTPRRWTNGSSRDRRRPTPALFSKIGSVGALEKSASLPIQ
jgi:hypothetical protein